MDFKAKRKTERRGAILHHLQNCKDYSANAAILLDVANGVGIPSYYSDLHEDLSWLEQKGYIVLGGDDAVVIVEATRRGLRLARDEETDPGVKRPDARI